jgi:hypothetical protein
MEEFLVDDAAKRCRNCGAAMPESARYCPQCGQKYTTGRIRIRDLIVEFFETVFNIESRFFKTLGAMFIPGKLTNEFFRGRHQTYFRPLRLFLIMTIVHFAVIAFMVNNSLEEDIRSQTNQALSNAYRISIIHEIDSVQPRIVAHYDPGGTIAGQSLDSLQRYFKNGVRDSFELAYLEWKGGIRFEYKNLDVSNEDLYQLSRQQILDKYAVQGFLPRLCIGQGVRVMNNLENTLGFIIGNFTWMLLLMMPALALILKLLYIRRKYYYVEHLIFSFHYHAFAFLLISPAYLLANVWPAGVPIAFGLVLLYLLIAMRRVYQQGWFKTLIKFWLLNQLYLTILAFFIIFIFIISALLY